jgi:AcrR family transcriptional regulator
LPTDPGPPPLGLRERKKARTRAAIQEQALHLFAAQGYAATTVRQIADAAEVSESTFFRYFPTKEDVVMHDRFDPLLLAAFAAQPAQLSPIAALRGAIAAVIGQLPAAELEQERQRSELILSIPELRARMLEQLAGPPAEAFAQAVAARVGRRSDELVVRNLVAAIIGVSVAALRAVADDPAADHWATVDAALAHLEAGLPL